MGQRYPVAPPELAGAEEMIGLFINTLPVRVRLRADMTLRQFLRDLQEQLVDQRQYEFCPLVDIQGWSEIPCGEPIFDSIAVFENFPSATPDSNEDPSHPPPEDQFSVREVKARDQTNYPLTLVGGPGERLSLRLMFDRLAYADDGAQRLLAWMVVLLETCVRDPELNLNQLPFMSPVQTDQIDGWTKGRQRSVTGRSLKDQFEEVVASHGDRVALTGPEGPWTYAFLNAEANRLAHYLSETGLEVNTAIGLCMARGRAQIVAILAILKIGCGYVPIDPEFPEERLAFLLEDSGVGTILGDGSSLECLPAFQLNFLNVIDLDETDSEWFDHPTHNLETQVDGDFLAYLIYTSGSTGQPKGVTVSQRAVERLIATADYTDLGADTVILQAATMSFDAATFEVWGALLSAGTLVLLPPGQRDLDLLADAIQHHGVTHLWLTVGLFNAMVDGAIEGFGGLRYVLFGGDVASPAHVTKLQSAYPELALMNMYGPTENTTFSTGYRVPCLKGLKGPLPIGRPIAGSTVEILNPWLERCTIGAPGELFTGGLGLALGYHQRPGLTAERFIPHPFGEVGDRLYRTGDLAAWMADGSVSFMGRKDFQVKVRGFRIELGEIEHALTQLSAVNRAVVLARHDQPGDKQLVAYIVPAEAQSPSESELAAQLANLLPAFMVPSFFLIMDQLPLTENGKVDRRALPAPDIAGKAEREHLAPRNEFEEMVANVFAQVLGLERVGRHANFFDLGGHSLMATQAVSRLRKMFGFDVDLGLIFEHPEVASLAKALEGLAGRDDHLPPIIPVNRPEHGSPLSFAQQRLWFIDRFTEGGTMYNIPSALLIEGHLDEKALSEAIATLVGRHESLRTHFREEEGQAFQVVEEECGVDLQRFDLRDSGLEGEALEHRARELIQKDLRRPFQLERGPLLRCWLLRLESDRAVFYVNMHHIVTDGWSMGIFSRELVTAYKAAMANQAPQWQPLAVQYPDFAHWQHQHLAGDELDRQLTFWKETLGDGVPVLELPFDRPRPPVQTFDGADYRFQLDHETLEALRQLGRRNHVTLFMVLLASYELLLHRLSGQTDFAVGSPIANRNRPEIEPMIGFFVNTLVFRVGLSGNPTFRELLERTRQVAIKAFENQDAPFERIVDELAIARDLSTTPLFQVMFVLQNAPTVSPQTQATEPPAAEREDETALQVREFDLEGGVTQFDLLLTSMETPDGLTMVFDYNVDLFERTTIVRMAERFQRLLTQILAEPNLAIGTYNLLDDEERAALMSWGQPQSDYPRELAVHQRFEAMASRYPDSVALQSSMEPPVSYSQLDAEANRLARFLNDQGVQAGDSVGLALNRSSEAILAMLAILKLGATYVPLDLDYPAERLRLMAEENQLRCLLVKSGDESVWQTLPILRLAPADWSTALSAYSTERLQVSVAPETVAYCMYTSGSTGQPKGALIPHRAIVRLVCHNPFLQPTRDDVFLLAASLNFDASTLEVWGPLLNGCRLVLLPPGPPTLDSLAATITTESVSVLWLTSGLFNLMVEQRLKALANLRVLFVGGDVVSPSHVAALQAQAPAIRIVNGYGPTENTTFTCTYSVPPQQDRNLPIPIGQPIANTSVWIVDTYDNLVPPGTPGELVTGGDGLALGYVNHPDLTEQRFVTLRVGDQSQRVYRTGDRARLLADGNLAFLGRIDDQVKVRGFRVEPGEVEVTLRQHEGLEDVCVLARADRGRAKQLVAYVVPTEDARPEFLELRHFLAERLPEYMIPSAFVALEELPLNRSGKVDRFALPAPGIERSGEKTFVAPSTRKEQALAEIWAQVLKRPNIGVNDNFFELGGDSILSIQIVARANQQGMDLTPKLMFQNQTIGALARAVGQRKPILAEQGLIVGELELLPIHRWFFARSFVNPNHFNQAVLLGSDQPLQTDALVAAFAALIRHHDALRLRFVKEPGGWQASHVAADEMAVTLGFSTEALTGTDEETRLQQLGERAELVQRELNIEHGPLTRLVHFTCQQGDYLLWVVHHLVVDTVSWIILQEDFHRAYESASQDKAIRLPDKTTSLQTWSDRLQATTAAIPEPERAFWLSARPAVASLPRDSSEGDHLESSMRLEQVVLEPELTRQLLYEVPRAYRTQINDVLLTALAYALADWTGTTTCAVNLEGHGREDLYDDCNLSRTVGWFTNLYPLFLELKSGSGLGENLKYVKEQLRAVPNKGMGYGRLRAYGSAAEQAVLTDLPQAEISFNYLGQVSTGESNAGKGSGWQTVPGPTGMAIDPASPRAHLLDITGMVMEGRLFLNVMYSQNRHRADTIRGFAHQICDHLKALVAHCVSTTQQGCTPSDFPLASVTQGWLDDLVAERQNIENLYPPTPLQQGMLFQSDLHAGAGNYVIQIGWTFRGTFNPAVFARAWDRVIRRHPILRTGFMHRNLGGEILQVVFAEAAIPVAHFDWQAEGKAEDLNALEAFYQEDRKRGFDVQQPPLRLSLIRLENQAWHFVWSHHHVLLDGWSVPTVMREVLFFYDAFMRKGDIYLEKPRPYADYIAWLGTQDQNAAEHFWREKLAGLTGPTPLPLAQNRFSQDRSDFGEYHTLLSEALTTELVSSSRAHQLTLNTMVQGAWALLLARYSGLDDVVFGATGSGRPAELAGVEAMVGLFINTLPVRVTIDHRLPLSEWLRNLQHQQALVRQYEYASLSQVQRWSSLGSQQAIFETILVFENHPVEETMGEADEAGTLHVEDFRGREQTGYPLTLVAGPGTRLSLKLLYDGLRYDEATVMRLLEVLSSFLSRMVTNLDQPLKDMIGLAAEERKRVLVDWNQTAMPFPEESTLYDLFAESVRRQPNQTALVVGDHSWSYSELHAMVGNTVMFLREHGLHAGEGVALLLPRDQRLVAAILAVLACGARYIPLDTNYPATRITMTLADAKPRILLSEEPTLAGFVDLAIESLTVLTMDDIQEAEGLVDWQAKSIDSGQPAYCIYTSGSTGRPKGVVLSHRNAVAMVSWAQSVYDPAVLQGVLASTSICFDLSIFELFVPLASGGTVVLVEDALALAEHPAKERVRLINTVPSAAMELLAGNGIPDSVRVINLAGEPLPHTLAKGLYQRSHIEGVYNLYGPSEDTTYSTWALVDRASEEDPPIGRPINNTRCYVLGESGDAVAAGQVGELYLAGAGLAQGYHNLPRMTAEHFVPDSIGSGAGERLYATGDLVRYRQDGVLTFLGRRDHLVKLRGFRIELGEIESWLKRLPNLEQAVVLVRSDLSIGPSLVAFVVPAEQVSIDVEDLRRYLHAKLPRYMVPNLFQILNNLPLQPNGKVDRAALHNRSLVVSERQGEKLIEPRTELERRVLFHWCAVLDREAVSIDDDFFALGGHSLLATKLTYRLREETEMALPMRLILEEPTVTGMARAIEQAQTQGLAAVVEALDHRDLANEACLPAYLSDLPLPDALGGDALDHILLTGATGFVGAFLLHELLKETRATIHCLVRATDGASGLARIATNLNQYGLDDTLIAERVIALTGDLGKPRLGLEATAFGELAETIDVIFHNGALVNFAYPYTAVRAANVMGTATIIELALRAKRKPIHFTSTLGVFPVPSEGEFFVSRERTFSASSEGLNMGYTQSKWVAEQLLRQARDQGLTVNIYRCGRIGGHSQSGACQPEDFIWRLLKASLEIGAVPNLFSYIEMMPVDSLVRAMVALALDPACSNENFHLFNPQETPFAKLVAALLEAGYQPEELEPEPWLELLGNEAIATSDVGTVGGLMNEGIFGGAGLVHAGHRTRSILTAKEIPIPAYTTAMLGKTIDYFRNNGYLNPPVVPAGAS